LYGATLLAGGQADTDAVNVYVQHPQNAVGTCWKSQNELNRNSIDVTFLFCTRKKCHAVVIYYKAGTEPTTVERWNILLVDRSSKHLCSRNRMCLPVSSRLHYKVADPYVINAILDPE
jgi:hypothetical protein